MELIFRLLLASFDFIPKYARRDTYNFIQFKQLKPAERRWYYLFVIFFIRI